jgi:tetratricopeptide (TPR) repeat protein
MTDQSTLFENLVHRRVPQIVGMYVAATWLVIELGDWVTERFSLPPTVTSYVFVAMLAMMPAVVLFSYNHGAPGKDRWTRTEKVLIPLNIAIAVAALYFFSPVLNVDAATRTVQIADETGVVQEYEVARQGYHQELIGFFWRNESGDSELDWLSYGLPLMLAHDLNRVSPVITVVTPFDSFAVRNELRGKGYPSFVDEPQGLRVDIARDRRSAGLIVGSFDLSGDSISVNAAVIDATSGTEIGSHSASGTDWLAAVDEVSAAILEYLDVKPSDNQGDDPLDQHFSDSLQAIEHFTNGQVALEINNDYSTGISELQAALELDPQFAEASANLSMTHYMNSDIEAAKDAVDNALRNSYRLSETSKFVLKANRYIYDGAYDRGERVVEIWTEVQPNSTEAFAAMAQLNRIRGTSESLAKAMAAYDHLLTLDPKDYGILRQKAGLEEQRGNFESAASHLKAFLAQVPDSADAYVQLAGVYQAMGDLEAATATLEDATILSDSPVESEIGLARLEARRGLFDEAELRLAGQLGDELGPQQRLAVLGALTEIAIAQGQIEKALAWYEDLRKASKTFMPPMLQLIGIDIERPGMLAVLGRIDEALDEADRIKSQLQPPLDAIVNVTYTLIYEIDGNQEAYRRTIDEMMPDADQFPPMLQPFLEMQQARVALWDNATNDALVHLDRSSQLLDQSILQVFQDSLSTTSLHVALAELYLEANAPDVALERLENILRLFPASAHAKLVLSKVHAARGNADLSVGALADAQAIWSKADPDYILAVEANELMDSYGDR